MLFALVAAGNLLSHLLKSAEGALYTKPFLVPLLMVFLIVSIPKKTTALNFTLGALFFSWLGDLLLLFQGEGQHYFLMGLGSFLAAHIIYVFTYKNARWKEARNQLLPTQRSRYISMLVLAGGGLLFVIWPSLGVFTVPVTFYTFVITWMTIAALNRFGYTSTESFGFVFGGAVLFMISDSILAVNMFLESIWQGSFWIMLTYILAQFCITWGLYLHMEASKK